MNFKNMKLSLLLAVGMLASFAAKAKAEFTTFTTTGVCVSTDTRFGLELMALAYSSGSVTFGDSYITLNDSVPLTYTNAGSTIGVGLVGEQWTPGLYPPASEIVPPIILVSTTGSASPSSSLAGSLNYFDFRDAQGNGIPVANGIVAHINGVKYGTHVTIYWRRRPANWMR